MIVFYIFYKNITFDNYLDKNITTTLQNKSLNLKLRLITRKPVYFRLTLL